MNRGIVLSVVLGLVGSGCGADDDDSGSSTGSTSDGTEAGTAGTTSTSGGTDTGTGTTSGGSSGSSGGTTRGGSTGGAVAPHVFFLNFDGATLGYGGPCRETGSDDATTDTTCIVELAIELAPYAGNEMQRDFIIDRVRSHWSPFNVEITDMRPATGPYVMVMITPTNPFVAGGISKLDCDNLEDSNIAFAFSGGGKSGATVAVTASSRIGATFGVANTYSTTDLSGANLSDDATWTDTCIEVAPPPPGPCTRQALAHCPTANEQNSARILLDQLGLP